MESGDLLPYGDEMASQLAKEATKGVGGWIWHAAQKGFSTLNNRFKRVEEKVMAAVPEKNRIPADSHTAAQVMLDLLKVPDESILETMFTELLIRSCDRERQGEVHPSFPGIITQLSPDEAKILYLLKTGGPMQVPMDLSDQDRQGTSVLDLKRPGQEATEFPLEELQHRENSDTYTEHLESLNLVNLKVIGRQQDAGGRRTDQIYVRERLSKLGKMFADACIPEEFPDQTAPEAEAEQAEKSP